MDSLRSIAEDLDKTIRLYEMDVVPVNTGGWLREVRNRLLALCDEAEKTDLVQQFRKKKVTSMSYPLEWSDQMTGEERAIFEALVDHIFKQAANECADELATWLAAKGIQP